VYTTLFLSGPRAKGRPPPAGRLCLMSCLRMLYSHPPRPSRALHVVSHRPPTAPAAHTRAAAAMCAALRSTTSMSRPPRAQPCRWRRGWRGAAQRAIRPLVARSAHVVQCQEVGIGRVRGPRVEWREPRASAVAAALPPRPRQGALGRAIRGAQEALANVQVVGVSSAGAMRVRQPKARAGAGVGCVEAECLPAQHRTAVAAGVNIWKHGTAIEGGTTTAPGVGWSRRVAATARVQAPACWVSKHREGITERRHVQCSVVVHSGKPFHRVVHALEQRPQPQDGLGRQPRVPRHDNGESRVGSVAHNDGPASC
jgi:hypothetical protein